MRGLDIVGVALIATMMLGPLALAPAYGPYVEPGTAAEVTEATTPLADDSAETQKVQSIEPSAETLPATSEK